MSDSDIKTILGFVVANPTQSEARVSREAPNAYTPKKYGPEDLDWSSPTVDNLEDDEDYLEARSAGLLVSNR